MSKNVISLTSLTFLARCISVMHGEVMGDGDGQARKKREKKKRYETGLEKYDDIK